MRRVRGAFHGRSPGLRLSLRAEGRFAAARYCARGGRAAAGGGSGGGGGGCGSIHDAAPPKKLRAKKQVAQAAIEAGAEREFQARYDDHQNEKEQMFVRLGMSQYYGSGG